MLKRRLAILALGLGLVVTVSYAQRKPVAKPAKPATAVKKQAPLEDVTLGSGLGSGAISRAAFLKAMHQPLRANGNVESFNFIFAERNMYEDSAGNPLPVTEFLTQTCYGDTLTAMIQDVLELRCKPGDTTYFDQIIIRKADGTSAKGRPLKFSISR